MNIREANEIVGGLSSPSKMPGYAFSVPAKECTVGSKLREVAGSSCADCYAMKNRYAFDNVQGAMYRRLIRINSHPRFVEAMTFLLNKRKVKHPYFRWHDSGDLQSVKHLEIIVNIANNTPEIKHWLPTREYAIVRSFVNKGGVIPDNLTIRLSGYMVDGPIPTALAKKLDCVTSSVTVKPDKVTCPSLKQGNSCQDCRMCWDKEVENITYKKH